MNELNHNNVLAVRFGPAPAMRSNKHPKTSTPNFPFGTATRVDGAKVAAPSLTFRVITALSHGRGGRWGCVITLSSGLHRSEHRVVSQIPPANKQDTFVPPPTLGMRLIIAKDFRTRTGQVLMIPGIFYQIFKYLSGIIFGKSKFSKNRIPRS